MEILRRRGKSWTDKRSSWLGLAGVMTGALILAVLFPAMAIAADSVGRILAVKGTVSVMHEGAKTPVPGAKNAQVFLGDRLNTGKSAKVKLLMKDDSIVTLGQNSELVVDKFVYAPETSTRKSVLKLAKGMVRNLIAKSFSGLGSVFEVHTPTAVAGAMGTENLVWVFNGSELPTEVAGFGGVTDISRIVLNSQFEGGAYMDYGSPGSIDWLRLASPGGGTGDISGNGGSGGFLVADNGGGNGGGPLNTLGVGISNDTQFGNQFGSVILNNGLASFAPEGLGPTEPFLLPPGTFNNLLGATDLSEGGDEGGDDGNEGGDGGDGGGDGGGEGDGGGRDGEGGDGGDGDPLQGAKDQMQDTLDGDQSGGLDGFSNDMNGDALGEFGQFAGGGDGGGGDGGAGGGDGGDGGDGTPNPDNNVNNPQPEFTVADTLGGLPGNSNAIFEDGFESGVFDETIYSGTNVGILPGYGNILPAGGSEMALVHNGPGNFGLLTLFLNLAAGNYNFVFDYNFTTNEGTGGNNYYNDFFRAFVTTSTGDVVDLAYASVNGNTFTPINNMPDTSPYMNSQTGWLNSSQVVALPAGETALNFFVRDIGDSIVDSAVFLDNLQVIPTTDPATVFPIEMGVIAAGTGFVGVPAHTTQ